MLFDLLTLFFRPPLVETVCPARIPIDTRDEKGFDLLLYLNLAKKAKLTTGAFYGTKAYAVTSQLDLSEATRFASHFSFLYPAHPWARWLWPFRPRQATFSWRAPAVIRLCGHAEVQGLGDEGGLGCVENTDTWRETSDGCDPKRSRPHRHVHDDQRSAQRNPNCDIFPPYVQGKDLKRSLFYLACF